MSSTPFSIGVSDAEKNDLLVPPFSSLERKSTLIVATFNLVATIVGGGVLSLPLAFSKCGVGLATILMVVAAVVTDKSLYLLCLCARQTGASSYGEVGRMAFGSWMERGISLLLFVFLMFVLVAYMVLCRDIWTPVASMTLRLSEPRGDLVLLGILAILSPFLVQRTLHALRFNCYIGFGSVTILCIALCHHGLFGNSPPGDKDMVNFSSNPGDVLFSLPIILLSFLCHFNILSIQGALVLPSRRRIQGVVDGSVLACFVLMYLFGLGGYMYALDDTKGNILLNVDARSSSNDVLFLLGRIGCGITIMLATPMMALPCRDSILEIIDVTFVRRQEEEDHHVVEEGVVNEHTTLIRHEPIQHDMVFANPYIHYGSTFAIIATCYIGAVAAPGVAIVWSLCGSSMAFLIAFILPAACFIEIQRRDPTPDGRKWVIFSWILLLLSTMAAIACTIQTMASFAS